MLVCLQGHVDGVTGVDISADGRYLLTGSLDNTVRLWDAATGKSLCQLVSFRQEGWVVVTAEGRFDRSENGRVAGLHWVLGDEPIELEQLTKRYYEPGLLAKLTGFNKEPVRDVETFRAPRLFPAVEMIPAAPDKACLSVRLTNRGGGIGRVVVKIDGKEITGDGRTPGIRPDAERAEIRVDLSGDPRLELGKPNVIEVQAYDAEGFLRSRGLRFVYTPPGELRQDPPQLWAIVVGTSHYRGEALRLRFAAKDAEDFGQAIEVVAPRLFGAERVHLTQLTTGQNDPQRLPTRRNLEQAFAAATEAQPMDTVLVYLAGHGLTHGDRETFY
jgi:hypothetical protein